MLVFILSVILVFAQAPTSLPMSMQLWNNQTPSGSCQAQQFAVNVTNNDIFMCNAQTLTWQRLTLQAINTGAGFFGFGQGTAQGHATANMAIYEAPAAVTAHEVKVPGIANSGIPVAINASAVVTEDFSGSSNYSSKVTIGSGTTISPTSLCSTTNCPAGDYLVSVDLFVTTACTSGGSYLLTLIYTDDTTVSKNPTFALSGSGVSANQLSFAAITNFAQGQFQIRSNGSAAIQYSTSPTACATGGPGIGTMTLHVIPLGP